jgi:outer membrane murein-binding lipoprotein Lpp
MIDWLPVILKGIADARVADVLREQVELLEMKRAHAVGERDLLATQLAQEKAKVETLESDRTDIRAQLNEARQEIQRLKQPADRLPEESEKMLVFLANDSSRQVTSERLIQHFGFPAAKGGYFFDQLLKRKLVNSTHGQMGVGWFYAATAEGREYMAQSGLL